jgi:hypothetical protein
MNASTTEPFADLPDALVRDLLAVALPVGDSVRDRIDQLRSGATQLREDAKAKGLVRRKADLERPREPSVAGVDGSYQIHSLTSIDLCATAAIAVEGTSKEAKRYWPEPYHYMWAGGVPHAVDTTGVLRGLMVSLELKLASMAPHDVVMLDGALASLVIYLNQGLTDLDAVPTELAEGLRKAWLDEGLFETLLRVLRSERLIALPKFTGRNELVAPGRLSPVAGFDGRTLATVVLEPGEYTTPLPTHVTATGDPQAYHLPRKLMGEDGDGDRRLNSALQDVRVTYFRPYGWVPALRIELPGPIANSDQRLALALEAVQSQFFTPAVVEPYPLFLADRMVKSLGAGVAVVEQTVAQHVADSGADIELTMLCLQQHRTQGGRGGV